MSTMKAVLVLCALSVCVVAEVLEGDTEWNLWKKVQIDSIAA